jgi:hypothetical protein
MLQSIQQQLASPTRFDTAAFNQIRQAQQQNLNAEFGAQRSQLEEEMARRGLSASSIGAGRYGDLAGQQARAQATMDAELLQQAAQTQSQDRLASLQAAGQFVDLAGSQDLAEFEANRVGQAQGFQERLAAAQFGQGQSEFNREQALQAANLQQTGGLAGMDLALRQQLGMGGLNLDAARLGQAGEQFGQSLAEQQAARQQQFGLSERELGLRQTLGIGELTGQVGGTQTLAASQQAEQQRQFNLQQQLQQTLGLGGLGIQQQEVGLRAQQLQQEAALQGRSLSIEEARLQAQQQQFGITTAEGRREFDLQQQLQQTLGLGGLDVQYNQLGLEKQRLQQQASDTAAERQLREALQTRELTAQEQQQLRDITTRQQLQTQQLEQQTGLERERLAQQQTQFGLQLNEQQSSRLQQYGISQQELGLRAQQLQQEASLQGRSLNIQEAQNLAQNELEGQKISQQNEQFTQNLSAEDRRFAQTLDEQKANRLQALGISNTELEQRARQISQQDTSLSLQEARDMAEKDFRAESLVQQAALEGNRINLDTARFTAERDFRLDQLAQQQDQFTATLGNEEQRFVRTLAEQQAGRIQQLGLSTRELDQRATQIADDARLRGQTLSLQQARDEAEIEARANAIASQEAMQGRQITSDEARNAALLAFQRDQLTTDATLRSAGIAVDRERLAANEKQFADDLALRTASLAQQETQFNANLGLDQQRMGLDQQRFQLQLAAALAALSPEQLKQFEINKIREKEAKDKKDNPPKVGQTVGDGLGPPGTDVDIDFSDLQRQLDELFRKNPITYG